MGDAGTSVEVEGISSLEEDENLVGSDEIEIENCKEMATQKFSSDSEEQNLYNRISRLKSLAIRKREKGSMMVAQSPKCRKKIQKGMRKISPTAH